MEEIPVEEDIDLEALQAQIDLSLAHTKELVSSWIKPTYGNASSSTSRKNGDKEIEEILRRPPRLGVGAPIPASTGSLGHESVKLKNKLSGKKRSREEDGIHDIPVSEDEEESRSRIIKKKTKLDPFAPKEKKKKKSSSTLASNSITTVPIPSGSHQSIAVVTQSSSEPAFYSSSQAAETNLPAGVPEKKKKKKKKRKATTVDTQLDAQPNEQAAVVPTLEQQSEHHGDVDNATPISHQTPVNHTEPSPSIKHPILKQSSEKSKPAIPLLNLQGLPEMLPDTPSPTKKKRKRRKNKKNRIVDTPAGGDNEGDGEDREDM